MLRSTVITLVCLAGLGMAPLLRAADRVGPYFSLTGGYTQPSGQAEFSNVVIEGQPLPNADVSVDDGWDTLVGLGYYINTNFRLEGEFGYRYNRVDRVTVDSDIYSADADSHGLYSLMINTCFDLPLNDRFELYAGMGIGGGILPAKIRYQSATTTSSSDGTLTSACYQAMAGVTVNLAEELHLGVGYRFFMASNSVEGSEFSGDWSLPVIHSVEISLRFDL